MAEIKYDELIQNQFQELRAKYGHLELHSNGNGYSISGHLGFSSEYQGIRIQDAFLIFIRIGESFPNEVPTVKEMGGRIPVNFHHNTGGTLCLATPTDQWVKFNKCKSLIGFVETLIVPFLFSFCFKIKTGRMPFGERSHGGLGILEFYCEYFELTDYEAARKLLKLLATGRYRRKKICPCGSGRRLESCHGSKFLEIMKMESVDVFKSEHRQSQLLGTSR